MAGIQIPLKSCYYLMWITNQEVKWLNMREMQQRLIRVTLFHKGQRKLTLGSVLSLK